MNQGNLGTILGLAVALATVGACNSASQEVGSRDPDRRPELALLTSLPLIFGESFGLEDTGSATLARLEQRYRVRPIAVADASSLKGRQLLLMAHPRAQPAEALVELDQWVRNGGHVLLLADPRLDWPSERPLGDRLRPPPAFADTGLLDHWGLSLRGPEPDERRSSGHLVSNGTCKIAYGGLVAHCPIGAGRATIIADADFIGAEGGLDLLIEELAGLESR